MAAQGISIFQSTETANEQMHAIFLETIVQKLHKQGNISASIFHPADFFKTEKSFFATAFSRLVEQNEDYRFSNWLVSASNKIVPLFNKNLSQQRLLPKDISPADFEEFMDLSRKDKIIDYILKDGERSLIATYAVKEDLVSTMHSKNMEANQCIESFCVSLHLDIDTFKNYGKLSHLYAKKIIPPISSTQDNTETSFVITKPMSSTSGGQTQEAVEQTEEEQIKFDLCKAIVQPITTIESEKIDVDLAIRKFCLANAISIEDLVAHTIQLSQTIPDTDSVPNEEETLGGLGRLKNAVKLVKRSLELEAEIQTIEHYAQAIQAIKAVATLRSIRKYERMLTDLADIFKIDPAQAKKIIVICGYGIIAPYMPLMTPEIYPEFIARRENLFLSIKQEVYYRIAEKEVVALKNSLSLPPLERIKSNMEYIVRIIEFASYDMDLFSGETIQYSFNRRSQKKDIPPLLADYRRQLKELIQRAADPEEDFDNYLGKVKQAIIRFQIALPGTPIHYKWHNQFLEGLSSMVNHLLEKGKATVLEPSPHSTMSDQPLQNQSPSSRSPSSVSFQSEYQRGNVLNASLTSTTQNDSPVSRPSSGLS